MMRKERLKSLPDKSRVQAAIDTLKKQEISYMRNGQFILAEQTKLKIIELKEGMIQLDELISISNNKENVKEVERLCQNELQDFKEEWDLKLRSQIDEAKNSERQLVAEHEREQQILAEVLMREPVPKVKFSSKVLNLRTHIENLLKVKQYLQAESFKKQLQEMENAEVDQWKAKGEEKKKIRFRELLKKQQNQFNVLRKRLETQFNDRVKQREEMYDRLMNRNQKRKIETNKTMSSQSKLSNRMNRSLTGNSAWTSKSTERQPLKNFQTMK